MEPLPHLELRYLMTTFNKYKSLIYWKFTNFFKINANKHYKILLQGNANSFFQGLRSCIQSLTQSLLNANERPCSPSMLCWNIITYVFPSTQWWPLKIFHLKRSNWSNSSNWITNFFLSNLFNFHAVSNNFGNETAEW